MAFAGLARGARRRVSRPMRAPRGAALDERRLDGVVHDGRRPDVRRRLLLFEDHAGGGVARRSFGRAAASVARGTASARAKRPSVAVVHAHRDTRARPRPSLQVHRARPIDDGARAARKRRPARH